VDQVVDTGQAKDMGLTRPFIGFYCLNEMVMLVDTEKMMVLHDELKILIFTRHTYLLILRIEPMV